MRTIGILGGMGPAAAADFYLRIVASHGALRDQDHPPCILYSATQVPDRTAFLLGAGPDPTPELEAAARLIEATGADFIAMPCNSAHAFLAAMRAAVSIPILDMIALAAGAVARVVPRARRIGILATTGTVEAGLYGERLGNHGLQPVYPDADVQQQVMAAIKDVKAGRSGGGSDARLLHAARHLSEHDADCIIMGCTEVPLALDAADSPLAAIDGNQMLVNATLALAVGRLDFEEVADAVR
jgi:aspartate racemase